MICDKRTENHNFTITTNTSQHVEFFHSLIFLDISLLGIFYISKIIVGKAFAKNKRHDITVIFTFVHYSMGSSLVKKYMDHSIPDI